MAMRQQLDSLQLKSLYDLKKLICSVRQSLFTIQDTQTDVEQCQPHLFSEATLVELAGRKVFGFEPDMPPDVSAELPSPALDHLMIVSQRDPEFMEELSLCPRPPTELLSVLPPQIRDTYSDVNLGDVLVDVDFRDETLDVWPSIRIAAAMSDYQPGLIDEVASH